MEEEDCFNCYWYVALGDYDEIRICCLHKIRIEPYDGIACRSWRWEYDLHDNDAMERTQQKNNQAISRQE